jgi:hypothetical protein
LGRRTLLERSGIAEVFSADLVVARGFYHLTVDQDVEDGRVTEAVGQERAGDGAEVAAPAAAAGPQRGRGYLEIWQGSLPIEPMCRGDIVLLIEGGQKLSADVDLYVPGAKVADFTFNDPVELQRLLPGRRLS